MSDYNSSHTGIEIDNAVDSVAKKLDNSIADFVPQPSPPVHGEGRVFYDDASHSLGVYSDIPGTLLNIGQESYVRVINQSGATILNGAACRGNGVSSGVVSVVLAQADTFEHSIVLGVATHDIPDGTEGFVTTHGSVRDINTEGHVEGQPMYLSDAVPGAWTGTPPQIVCRVGGVLIADSTNGSLFVNIMNNVMLPVVIGFLNEGDVPGTINSTPLAINNYQIEGSYLTIVDKAAGTIHVLTEGIYRVTATINIQHDDAGNNTGIIGISIYDELNIQQGIVTFSVLKNQIATNLPINIPFNSVANKTYHLRIVSSVELTNVTTNAVSFDIKSESIR
ncbi:MAG: hypothetical protein DRJ15_10660 [Bacteroidetes bacterium]|nr:MAG: hypothetical protein DRJ15_10660 [Bacteroidota bacterium]